MSPIAGISSSGTERDVPVIPVIPNSSVTYAPPAPASSIYVLEQRPEEQPRTESK